MHKFTLPTSAAAALLALALLSGCVTTTPDAAGAAGAGTVQVLAKDVKFAPLQVEVTAGTTVVWVNKDPMAHTVTADDGSYDSGLFDQGESWSHRYDEPGVYHYYCTPHSSKGSDGAMKGMVGTVVVKAGAVNTAQQSSAQASPPPAKTPDTLEIGADASAVPAPIQRTGPAHLTFNITSKEVVAKMADGITYTYWTFDGTVPGPMLRARVGDTITINHHNDASSTMSHNIDFHAATGPGGGAGALKAAPGMDATLTFKALSPGLFVYHCADAAPPVHIGHGMYGLILIEPEAGLPPVDKEFYVMQGDFYSAYDAGQKGHHEYDSAQAADERPSFVVFNGRMGSLAEAQRQLQAATGETVRIFFGVGGPNLVSSFHVIGEIFDDVYSQGDLVSSPQHGLQTILVPSGGAAIVDFGLEVPGNYLLVDHSINRVLKGAAGILHVTGEAEPGVFEAAPGSPGH